MCRRPASRRSAGRHLSIHRPWRDTRGQRPYLAEAQHRHHERRAARRGLHISQQVPNPVGRRHDTADDIANWHVPRVHSPVRVALRRDRAVGLDRHQAMAHNRAVLDKRDDVSHPVLTLPYDDRTFGWDGRRHRPGVYDVRPVRQRAGLVQHNRSRRHEQEKRHCDRGRSRQLQPSGPLFGQLDISSMLAAAPPGRAPRAGQRIARHPPGPL